MALALLLTLLAAAPQNGAEPPRPCMPGAVCCASNLAGFCRVGCPPPHPVAAFRPAVDLTNVSRPYPTGVAILEIGVNADGRVVSACVLRGLRSDFDEAAQRAALQSRWKPQLLNGHPVGAVMTVTFDSPMSGHWSRPALTSKSALPITRGPITFVAPNAACPPWKGQPVVVGTIVDPPLLDYVEPRAPSLLNVSGTVILEAMMAGDGRVARVEPLREVEGLTDAAVDAVRKWRFARTCLASRAAPLIKAIALSYRIESAAVRPANGSPAARKRGTRPRLHLPPPDGGDI